MSHCLWGSHDHFAALYDDFLDAVYPGAGIERGRWAELVGSIDRQLTTRGATKVLDCAAGSGFPSVDLAAMTPGRYEIHCSDGDRGMIAALAKRASEHDVDLEDLRPPRFPGRHQPRGIDGLVLNWTELCHVDGRYDYVLCRGNSLAYADTWTGRRRVATESALRTYLFRMAEKLRPGGFLHVDAPWALDLRPTSYRTVDGETGAIWEKVSVVADAREWWLSFKPKGGGRPFRFKRYSSLLTIDRIEAMLKELGFGKTKPFQLDGERPVFATIIAQKPESGWHELERCQRPSGRRT